MKIQIKTFILVVILLISIGSYLYFSTPLFYDKISLEPIKIYYGVSQGDVQKVSVTVSGNETQQSIASKQKYPIRYVKFKISNLFKESWNEFKIGYENFKQEINFWYMVGDGSEMYNTTKRLEYEKNNIPDYLIKASFIKNGFVPVWSQVWNSQPTMSVIIEPFLKQTSYGIWEREYFFDTKFSGTQLNGETYLTAEVKNIIFEINIPDNFKIESADDIKLDKVSGGYLLTKELESGKTFHLVIKDIEKEKIKIITGFSSLALFGIILAMFIQQWYEKRRKK